MSSRFLIYLALLLSLPRLADASDDKTLAKVSQTPAGLSQPLAAKLDPQGYRVQTAQGAVCDVWLLKDLAAKPGFKPTLNVKYPFQSGELIGVLRVADKVDFTDFRGQAIKPGVYTLRYGQQPQDGNHIGTSEVSDFLLALPAATDTNLKPLGNPESLHKASAKAAGGNHPAIFSLLPSEAPVTSAMLAKDDNNHWVLSLPVPAVQGGKKISVSLRLIVIGKAEG